MKTKSLFDRPDFIFEILLVIFVPLTLILELIHASPLLIFFSSTLAILPLAKFIGKSTEELAAHTGSALGGLMNATFGNIVELSIGAFSLHAGLVDMVKASLIGAIIGNVLLVLGMAIYLGGRNKEYQEFNKLAAAANSSILLLATGAFILPFLAAKNLSASGAETVSIAIAAIMVVAYSASLLFSLHSHKKYYAEKEEVFTPTWSKAKAVFALLSVTVLVAAMSEILVSVVEPIAENYGWTEMFLGMFFIAVIGNAAEHVTAVTLAMKDRMEMALSITVGSSSQVAMFVVPVLVFVSYFFPTPMNLIFTSFELGCMFLSTLILKSIIEDGKSHWFEGVVMIGTYGIMAAIAFNYR